MISFQPFLYLSILLKSYIDNEDFTENNAEEDNEKKRSMVRKNNFFMSMVANYYLTFNNLTKLSSEINNFLNNILSRQSFNSIEVELFFFLLNKSTDKAPEKLKQKYASYFKKFLTKRNAKELFQTFININHVKDFEEMQLVEVMLMRELIVSALERGMGVLVMCGLKKYPSFFKLLIEGRVWKKIVMFTETKLVIDIWENYLEKINKAEIKDYKKTIDMRYEIEQIELNLFNQEDFKEKEVLLLEDQREEFYIHPVFSFADFLQICFKFTKSKTISAIYEQYRHLMENDIEVLEVCLNFDEYIAM